MLEHTNKASHRMHETVSKSCNVIHELASSLYTLGMDRAAESLWEITKDLRDASKALGDATGKDVAEMYRQSGENSRNILNAVIAGRAIGSGKEEDIEFAKTFVGVSDNDEN